MLSKGGGDYKIQIRRFVHKIFSKKRKYLLQSRLVYVIMLRYEKEIL